MFAYDNGSTEGDQSAKAAPQPTDPSAGLPSCCSANTACHSCGSAKNGGIPGHGKIRPTIETTKPLVLVICILPGWWYTYPSEKYESQLVLLFPIYGKTCSKPPTSV